MGKLHHRENTYRTSARKEKAWIFALGSKQISGVMKSAEEYKPALRSFRFQRGRAPGIIEVLNENSYVMAEYTERTGCVKWQRLVPASQREQIEKWLKDHYAKT